MENLPFYLAKSIMPKYQRIYGYNVNKVLLVGLIIGVVIGMALGPRISNAIYSIPPTNAWDQILFRYSNWTVTNIDNINATSYSDNLYLISDGSILFNVTTYP